MTTPDLQQGQPRPDALLKVDDLVVEYPIDRHRVVHAVSNLSFEVMAGETLGLVGESGCGKSTTGRAIMQLPPPTKGRVWLDGAELTAMSAAELRATRPKMQMIFQDPISSLNPRRTVRDAVAQGLDLWREGSTDAKVDEVLEMVGFDPAAIGNRRPHELSGGQCQRVCIARAVALEPRVLICDEPVSALDVSVQANVLNILEAMKARYGLTLVFIAHDLAVVKNISDRIAVMYLGKFAEIGDAETVCHSPAHPYTQALISSVRDPEPQAQRRRAEIRGEVPSPIAVPRGCRFNQRCPKAQPRCIAEEPALREIGPRHYVACHYPDGEGG